VLEVAPAISTPLRYHLKTKVGDPVHAPGAQVNVVGGVVNVGSEPNARLPPPDTVGDAGAPDGGTGAVGATPPSVEGMNRGREADCPVPVAFVPLTIH